MRILIGILIVLHGLLCAIMFALPVNARVKADMAPFDPSRSWLLGERPKLGFGLALVVTALFGFVASGYLAQAGWWPWVTLVACVASLVLLGLFASRYCDSFSLWKDAVGPRHGLREARRHGGNVRR